MSWLDGLDGLEIAHPHFGNSKYSDFAIENTYFTLILTVFNDF